MNRTSWRIIKNSESMLQLWKGSLNLRLVIYKPGTEDF